MSKASQRAARLLPGGIPRYLRIYDNGGETADRYTVIFTGRYAGRPIGRAEYVGLSEHPFSPLGVCQHGEGHSMMDTDPSGYAPKIGRSGHLGKRIAFGDLPEPCQRIVMRDYLDTWGLLPM